MVRVIIERHCKPGKSKDLEKHISDLRMRAIPMRGFSSGQTLKSVEDPELYLVISNWMSRELWNKWYSSDERKKISEQISPLLSSPEKVTLFNFVG
jgi:heme-degrading monooxygenase HmoA